jgi:hypothetical protein
VARPQLNAYPLGRMRRASCDEVWLDLANTTLLPSTTGTLDDWLVGPSQKVSAGDVLARLTLNGESYELRATRTATVDLIQTAVGESLHAGVSLLQLSFDQQVPAGTSTQLRLVSHAA